MQRRLADQAEKPEWADVRRDLERVQYVDVDHQGKHYRLRSELKGTAGSAFQAAGVAVPPTVQLMS